MNASPALFRPVTLSEAQCRDPDDRRDTAVAYRLEQIAERLEQASWVKMLAKARATALGLYRTRAEVVAAARRACVEIGGDPARARDEVLAINHAQARTRHLWLKRPLRPRLVVESRL